MALISDLVVELSVISGIPEPSITVVARHLREAGLLSQKGRGRGAAGATPLDAARLCIALMLGRKAKDAPSVVKDFGQLQCWSAEVEPDHKYSDFNLERVAGLKVGHSFEEGFTALIAVWTDTALVDKMEKRKGQMGFWPSMLATLSDGTLTGEIRFGVAHYDYSHAPLLQADRLYREDVLEGAEERVELNEQHRAIWKKYFSGIVVLARFAALRSCASARSSQIFVRPATTKARRRSSSGWLMPSGRKTSSNAKASKTRGS